MIEDYEWNNREDLYLEDMVIDTNRKEILVLVGIGEFGPIYKCLTFALVDEIHAKIHKTEQEKGNE